MSSMAHTMATNGISFDDINFENNFNSAQVYAQSKLANVLHAKELAKRLENTGISVYSLHPGTYTIHITYIRYQCQPFSFIIFDIYC